MFGLCFTIFDVGGVLTSRVTTGAIRNVGVVIRGRVGEMIWKGKIENFSPGEWKEDSKKVDENLVILVDKFATFMKKRYKGSMCIIHVAYEERATDSQHPLGKAVDLHFVGVPLLDQFLEATRFPFKGIGVYPFWKKPGLHLDIRDAELAAHWWRAKDGEYKYLDHTLISTMISEGIA